MTDETNTGDYSSGHYNSGHYNSGDCNSGDRNTGHYNTGRYNTDDRNSGNYNTGDCNTGHYNTGDCNSGRYNSGDCNSGDRNSGNYNSGNYNTGSYHVGCFNTGTPEKAYYFNKLIDKEEWDSAKKPWWIYGVSPTTWVLAREMTDQEKADNPTHETTGGYLRKNNMKEEWVKAFAAATSKDIELTKALPAFDAEVFLEITGIDLRDKAVDAPCEGREVEIDGVTYVLNLKGEAA